jgi:exodeoxyribonuclease V alpha subunit
MIMIHGKPGTGKTTILKSMLGTWEIMGFSVVVVARTAKAVNVVFSRTKHEDCFTIDRLFTVCNDRAGALARNDRLIVVVDEFSMVDIVLMHKLLLMFPLALAFIMTGDANQLPPIGERSLMRTLMQSKSNKLHMFKLKRVYRQQQPNAALTKVIDVLETKLHKEFPVVAQTDFPPNDSSFVHIQDTKDDMVVRLITKENVTVLVAFNETRKRINRLVQQRINPENQNSLRCLANNKREEDKFEAFRIGDLVICESNVYDSDSGDLLCARGCLGYIKYVHEDQKTCIEYNNGFVDCYEHGRGFQSDFELAYAVTVDRAQGDEYPRVIVYLEKARKDGCNLLYTAVSRARNLCILVATSETLYEMTKTSKRSKLILVQFTLTLTATNSPGAASDSAVPT